MRLTLGKHLLPVSLLLATFNAFPAIVYFTQCPQPSTLFKAKGTLFWGARGGWQSYRDSFATHLTTFIGAQWAGVVYGHIMCLYTDAQGSTFPVPIRYNKIVRQPSKGHWTKDKGGYINCRSHRVSDCPFTAIKPKPETNIYQTLINFKNHPRKQLQAF